jgi:hypothetical protein
MAWENVVDNQTISFNNLQSAVNQLVFVQKSPIPTSSEQITKADADTYVYLDTLYAGYADKSSNQLVVKNNLQSTTMCMGGTNAYPYKVVVSDNGSFYIGGTFSNFSGSSQNRLVKCLQSGYKDSTFNIGSGPNQTVRTITPSGDKVFIGGDEISTYNGTSTGAIVKLNSDGTIDTSFTSLAVGGTATGKSITGISVLPDGKIVVAGDFTTYGANFMDNGMILNSDGSFNASLYLLPNGYVRTLLVNNNDIFAGGIANSHVQKWGDTSFNNNHTFSGYLPGSVGITEVFDLAILSNGKIVVVGDFTSVNGYSRNGIVILNSDGTVDTNFNPGSGFNRRAFSVKVLQNGYLVVGGDFTTYNGYSNNRIILLQQDGGFWIPTTPVDKFNNEVDSIDILPGDIILAVGAFTTYDNQDPCINGDYTAALRYQGPSRPPYFNLINCYFNPTPTPTPSITPTPTPTPIPYYLVQNCADGATQLTVNFNGTVTIGNVYQIYDPTCYAGFDGVNCWEVLSTSTNAADCSVFSTGVEYVSCLSCLGYYSIGWSFSQQAGGDFSISVNGIQVVYTTVGNSGTINVSPGDYVSVGVGATAQNPLIAEACLTVNDGATTLYNNCTQGYPSAGESYGPYYPSDNGNIQASSYEF